jgi:hypothetical protein
MTMPRKLAPRPVRAAALVASALLAVLVLVLAGGQPRGIVAILPGLLAVEIGRQLWRGRR